MSKLVNLVGKEFGQLIVLGKADKPKGTIIKWLCLCDCGNETVVQGGNLRSGNTKSCGCLGKNNIDRTTHGMARSRTYESWHKMKQRCTNPRVLGYKNWGGRGIKFCKRWIRFENFYTDMGERPVGKSLDRIDNNGNYNSVNCKWSTPKEQNNNKGVHGI